MKSYMKLALVAALLAGAVACRTNEENYRIAYEKAVEKDRANLDPTIYDKIRQKARPVQVQIDGETVGMRREAVAVTDGQAATREWLRRYSVVVAQFKQRFHAFSMCERLEEQGFTRPFVVETREPLYYVIAASNDTATVARDITKQLEAAPPFKLQEGCPWILYR